MAKKYKITKDIDGCNVIVLDIPITIYIDEDTSKEELTKEELEYFLYEMERTELGEQVLNHIGEL